MTQLTESKTELSTDIHVITAEVNAYKRIAGEAIFEIGRRLKHVKETDLAHGGFGSWLESVEIDRTLATRLMKVSDELSGKYATSHNLGVESLYLIATLPEAEREKPHTIPSTGAVKTVDDMTVRELREVKKALKDAEERESLAQARAKKAEEDYDTIRSLPREVETQIEYVENEANEEAIERLQRYADKFGDIEIYEQGSAKLDNVSDVSAAMQTFSYEVRKLIKKYAFLAQYTQEIPNMHGAVTDEYSSALDALNSFNRSLRDDYDSSRRGVNVINM